MEGEIVVYNPSHLLFLSMKKAVIKFLRNNFLIDIEVFSFNIAIDSS